MYRDKLYNPGHGRGARCNPAPATLCALPSGRSLQGARIPKVGKSPPSPSWRRYQQYWRDKASVTPEAQGAIRRVWATLTQWRVKKASVAEGETLGRNPNLVPPAPMENGRNASIFFTVGLPRSGAGFTTGFEQWPLTTGSSESPNHWTARTL